MNRAASLLAASVKQLMSGEAYRRVLELKRLLPSYSVRNCWLIHTQRPNATVVMGYRSWQRLERQVNKGEKGLAILAPITKTFEENGEKERRLIGFRSASVFDLSVRRASASLE